MTGPAAPIGSNPYPILPTASIVEDKTPANISLQEETEAIDRHAQDPNDAKKKATAHIVEDPMVNSISLAKDANQQPDAKGPANPDQFSFVPRKLSEADKKSETEKLILLSIPFFGVGYDIYLGSNINNSSQEWIKTNPFHTKSVQDLIARKNEVKKVSLKAFAINALFFSLFLGVFPFSASLIATGYLCFALSKAIQTKANNELIERLQLGTVIPPVGPNGIVNNGKTEFVWSDLVE